MDDDQASWSLAPMWETCTEFWVPTFGLAWPWWVWAFEELAVGGNVCLSVSVFQIELMGETNEVHGCPWPGSRGHLERRAGWVGQKGTVH